MYTVKCSKCGHENKNTNIKCESCGEEINTFDEYGTLVKENGVGKPYLIEKLDSKKVKRGTSAFVILLVSPLIVIGAFLILFGYFMIQKENAEYDGYLKTKGTLVDFENCQDGDGYLLCNAVYEYTVDGVVYKSSPKILDIRSDFRKIATVKYNPNNPSEYTMDSGLFYIIKYGIIIIAVALGAFVLIRVFLKILARNLKGEKKDSTVSTT